MCLVDKIYNNAWFTSEDLSALEAFVNENKDYMNLKQTENGVWDLVKYYSDMEHQAELLSSNGHVVYVRKDASDLSLHVYVPKQGTHDLQGCKHFTCIDKLDTTLYSTYLPSQTVSISAIKEEVFYSVECITEVVSLLTTYNVLVPADFYITSKEDLRNHLINLAESLKET